MTRSFVKTASGAVRLHDGMPAGPGRRAHERHMAGMASALRTAAGRPFAPAVLADPPDGGIAFAHVDGVGLDRVLDAGPAVLRRRAVTGLAAAVAALHTATVPADLPIAPRITSTPFDLVPDDLRALTGAAVAVHRDVTDTAAALWAPAGAAADHLVHNDLRAVNVLVPGDGDPVLIDWEFAGRGAPSRDVGSVLADLVGYALAAAWSTRRSSGDASGATTADPLAALFVREYRHRAGRLPDVRGVEAELAVALFHTAVARAQRDGQYHPVDRAAMGVVRRLGRRPGRLWHTLGVDPGGAAA